MGKLKSVAQIFANTDLSHADRSEVLERLADVSFIFYGAYSMVAQFCGEVGHR